MGSPESERSGDRGSVEGRDWPLRMSGREPCIWARLTEGKGCKKRGVETAQMLEYTSPTVGHMQIICKSKSAQVGTSLRAEPFWSPPPTDLEAGHSGEGPPEGETTSQNSLSLALVLLEDKEVPRERPRSHWEGELQPSVPLPLLRCLLLWKRGVGLPPPVLYLAADFVDLRDSGDRGHRSARIDFSPRCPET